MVSHEGHVDGRHFTTYIEDVKRLKRSGQLAEAEHLLEKLVGATEAEASTTGMGVAPWYYEQLAILYRKQKRYDAEVKVLERYEQMSKAPGGSSTELARRLEEAVLLTEGRNGKTPRGLRTKRYRSNEVIIETDLGSVAVKNPNRRSIAVIALGQSAEHLHWYYDVHRKQVLVHAVENLNQYLRGEKPQSNWDGSYFEFMQRSPRLLAELPQDRDTALQENQASGLSPRHRYHAGIRLRTSEYFH